ncbi:DUF6011 domain-containing protein [Alkalihalobacillus hemicellulosilyticus]|uniref:Phage protein n=1 Tax=Halalkalibacter hemicellulosilyticusJCM 9152 TaxID=1236971 RepID=W4QM74_9BACI|nr:DUF6011 domain-containing protein [Halalkalibacter hemicellulosilyticus]GAE32424.1 hypothetical protein JCM9152_3958 [Halalkalibacter hemicellulosilyticusJCM 9152]
MTEIVQCKRCGRALKSESSRKKGYGPTCAKKAAEEPQELDSIELLTQANKDQEQNFMDELNEELAG